MHIRGSSHKDHIDFRNELQIFLLHDDEIYWWSEGQEGIKLVIKIDCSNMQP